MIPLLIIFYLNKQTKKRKEYFSFNHILNIMKEKNFNNWLNNLFFYIIKLYCNF
jgi:hypothetical protein